MVRLLISKGADCTRVRSHGCTILHQAAMTADEETFEILASASLRGLDPQAKDKRQMNARHYLEGRPGVSEGLREAFDALIWSLDTGNNAPGLIQSDTEDEDELLDALERQFD